MGSEESVMELRDVPRRPANGEAVAVGRIGMTPVLSQFPIERRIDI
jgi:hypothetical protein